MIHTAFAPSGARITESYLTEDHREIDILIESEHGMYSLKVAVEAKDESRPLQVGVVETMIGKYHSPGGIPVNKVVLVARNGFTQGAKQRAAAANPPITLLTLDEAHQSDWTKLVPQQMVWRMPPHIHGIYLYPDVPSQNGKNALADGKFVCACHGHDRGSPLQWANWLLHNQVLPNACVAAQLDAQPKQRGGQVTMTLHYPMSQMQFDFNGRQHTVEELRLEIHYVSASGPVQWSSFNMSGADGPDRITDQLEAKLGQQRMRILFPDGPKSQRIVLKMDALPAEEHPHQPEPVTEKFEFRTLPPARFCCPLHTPPAPLPVRPKPDYKAKGRPNPTATRNFTRGAATGRNEPCPCGSGQKYKKCCWGKRKE
jgi:hypothetical protein